MFCRECGNEVLANSKFCGFCGAGLSAPVLETKPTYVERAKTSSPGREQILQEEIAKYIRQGFTLGQQTENSVELIKPKKYNYILMLLWFAVCFPFFFVFGIGFLVFIFGFVIYSIYFAVGKKNLQVYIAVTETGEVRKTESRVAYYVRPVAYR